MALKTDYVDDELAVSMGGKRQFNIVDSNGNILYENVHIEDTSKYSTVGDDFGAEDINETNGAVNQLNSDLGSKSSASAVAGNDAFSKIATLNSDLTDVATSSQIGSGTKIFSISNTRKRLLCITKKSGVIVETKEIPTSVLESGDVVLLGNSSPVIGTDNTGTNTPQQNLIGKELYYKRGINPGNISGTSMGTMIGTDGTWQQENGYIGLATDLSATTGASITYNGSNSFTITVTDSTLSVYVY